MTDQEKTKLCEDFTHAHWNDGTFYKCPECGLIRLFDFCDLCYEDTQPLTEEDIPDLIQWLYDDPDFIVDDQEETPPCKVCGGYVSQDRCFEFQNEVMGICPVCEIVVDEMLGSFRGNQD